MCGIFGIIQPQPFSGNELTSISRTMRHRGPDDEGYVIVTKNERHIFGSDDTPANVYESDINYSPRKKLETGWMSASGGVALGHRRLSIVDLSPAGHQPMSYKERYWIVYNGEIYNYIELRETLRTLGHKFSSDCDTEVILAAYAEWGHECLARFNGMWGLAIADLQRGSLFVARDRFGVKPLYFWVEGSRFVFASEIKGFAAIQGWSAKANEFRLMEFLFWNASDHTKETMFDGVNQLPAGHFLILDFRAVMAGQLGSFPTPIRTNAWYTLPGPGSQSSADPIREFRSILEDSVRLRLRADVPVGSCLSGGLDSSTIVCLMRAELDRLGISGTLRTITARSLDGKFEEGAFAQMVIDATSAVSHFTTPVPDDLFASLDKLTWHQDEPFASTSIFAQWCVFKEAKHNGVTVMLDGQGADEALCGYRGFIGAYLAGLVRNGSLTSWFSETKAINKEIGFSYLRSLGYTLAYLSPSNRGFIGRFDSREEADRSWVAAPYKSYISSDPISNLGGRSTSVYGMSVGQITATNLPRLLHWEDRNSMAFSIEARVPFLDYRVVEICLRMPDVFKIGGGIQKSILRRSMRNIVPDPVLDRRDKMGFLTAEPFWMLRDAPDSFRRELTNAVAILAKFVSPAILSRFEEVLSGKRAFDGRYWRIISAGRWAKLFNVQLRG